MLTHKQVQSLHKPGWYGEGRGGHGLTLVISPKGVKSWVQRLRFNGKLNNIGLGSVKEVSLAKARKMAAKNHKRTRKGKAPKSYRQFLSQPARKGGKGGFTFAKAAEETIVALSSGWKHPETMARQWRQTLGLYAAALSPVAVADIRPKDVLAVVEPIWAGKRETAKAVLQRICKVLDRVTVQGHREYSIIPAQVTAALPANGHKTKHHAALTHGEVGKALASINLADAMRSARMAMQFLVLTATRSAETTGARWQEIDLEGKVWVIPASRMKAKREHRVPLSTRAMAILQAAKKAYGDTGLVFPGKGGRVLSGDTLRNLAKPHKATVHGFRSSFRDWAAETGVAREVAEACLAHKEQNQTVAAYARTDLLEQRQGVMQDWADYLAC